MQSKDYLQDSFDLKLFFLNCIKRLWIVLLAMLLGSVLVGGIYYVKNVTLAGQIPFQITNKYYLTYEVDPSDQLTYSYFAGYTWTDFLQSDASVERIGQFLQEKGVDAGSREKIRGAYAARLESDLRVLYVTVTDVNREYAQALSEALVQEMLLFPAEHREIAETSLMTTGEVGLAKTDIRTFRAFVLGAVLGGFFAVFGLGLGLIISDGFDTPIQLQSRFGIPVLGYVDRQGRVSENCLENATNILEKLEKPALISVDSGVALKEFSEKMTVAMQEQGKEETQEQKLVESSVENELEKAEWILLEDALHTENKIALLQEKSPVVVAVQAGCSNGAAVKQLLIDLEQNQVPVSAMVLMGVDSWLIRLYMFGRRK